MKNIEEFKKLMETYRAMTIEDLMNERRKMHHEGYNLENVLQYEVLSHLTGFGSTGTCSLCKIRRQEAEVHACIDCVWYDNQLPERDRMPCTDHYTYAAIEQADEVTDLFVAVKNRADYMEEWLNQKLAEYERDKRDKSE